jgi:hypothetical protein
VQKAPSWLASQSWREQPIERGDRPIGQAGGADTPPSQQPPDRQADDRQTRRATADRPTSQEPADQQGQSRQTSKAMLLSRPNSAYSRATHQYHGGTEQDNAPQTNARKPDEPGNQHPTGPGGRDPSGQIPLTTDQPGIVWGNRASQPHKPASRHPTERQSKSRQTTKPRPPG